MVGSFSLGNAAPNIAALFGAKGGAAVIYDIIDRVSVAKGVIYEVIDQAFWGKSGISFHRFISAKYGSDVIFDVVDSVSWAKGGTAVITCINRIINIVC